MQTESEREDKWFAKESIPLPFYWAIQVVYVAV